MPEGIKIEELIRKVYRFWKADRFKADLVHPDEEKIVCFLEGGLSLSEAEEIKAHLVDCQRCAESFAIQVKASLSGNKPGSLREFKMVKKLFTQAQVFPALEIILQVKDKILKVLKTNGVDATTGLKPEVLLRGPGKKDSSREGGVAVIKKFRNINIRVEVENKAGKNFTFSVFFRKNNFRKIHRGRVTLLKDGKEIESYATVTGKVLFENVPAGRYILEIFDGENKAAIVILDIEN